MKLKFKLLILIFAFGAFGDAHGQFRWTEGQRMRDLTFHLDVDFRTASSHREEYGFPVAMGNRGDVTYDVVPHVEGSLFLDGLGDRSQNIGLLFTAHANGGAFSLSNAPILSPEWQTFTYTATDRVSFTDSETIGQIFRIRVCDTEANGGCPPDPTPSGGGGGGGGGGGSSSSGTLLALAAVGGAVYYFRWYNPKSGFQPFVLPLGEDAYVAGFDVRVGERGKVQFSYGEGGLGGVSAEARVGVRWVWGI